MDMTCSSARKVRILVVDDNRDAAESLGLLLTLSGYTVSLAFDGEKAIELAIEQRPEIVLLDIRLPRLSGYQVASRIRRELSSQSLIIAISGMTKDDTRKSAAESGCDHFLVKPVDHGMLLELFSEFLGKETTSRGLPPVQMNPAAPPPVDEPEHEGTHRTSDINLVN